MLSNPQRLRILGTLLVAAGLAVAGFAFLYGVPTAKAGLDSAQAMYDAQGVTLSYNDDGRLVDRGTVEGAQGILALLRDDWKYPVNEKNFDPDDPVVNTRDELMFQYATITYHVLHGDVAVTLTAEQVPVVYRGVTYTEPGVYDIAPEKYYAALDRTHPIEGQLRSAWTAQAQAITSSLAGGHANQAAGELALMTSLGMGGVGLLFAVAGVGLVWTTFGQTERAPVAVPGAGYERPAARVPVTRQPYRGHLAPAVPPAKR